MWRTHIRCRRDRETTPLLPLPMLTDLMCTVQLATPSVLSHPLEWMVPLSNLPLDAVLQHRGGLPRLAKALNGEGPEGPLQVCFLGGSVTEQRTGYRPRVMKWLEAQAAPAKLRVEEVTASRRAPHPWQHP
jgi:hypothetical protein